MADPASSDLEDTSTTSLFNWSSNRLTGDNWNIGDFLKAGLGLTIVGIFAGMMDVLNAIITFITTPLSMAGEAIGNLFEALVNEPVTVLSQAADATGQAIGNTFTGWLGPFAFPAGVASILGGLYLVSIYLENRQTSDIFPGSFTDINVPEFIPIIGDPGVAEAGEDQEDRD